MGQDLSLRLAACMNTLPLRQGMPVLEIGCGCSPRLVASLERPLDKNRDQKLTVRTRPQTGHSSMPKPMSAWSAI